MLQYTKQEQVQLFVAAYLEAFDKSDKGFFSRKKEAYGAATKLVPVVGESILSHLKAIKAGSEVEEDKKQLAIAAISALRKLGLKKKFSSVKRANSKIERIKSDTSANATLIADLTQKYCDLSDKYDFIPVDQLLCEITDHPSAVWSAVRQMAVGKGYGYMPQVSGWWKVSRRPDKKSEAEALKISVLKQIQELLGKM